MVILIIAVSVKPDSAFVSGPCTLIEGTSESQDWKPVVFNQINTERKGEMNCPNDYAKYQTSKKSTSKYMCPRDLHVGRHDEFWFCICNG